MEIFFCDRCGRRVTEAELERGECVSIDEGVFCRLCIRDNPEVAKLVEGAKARELQTQEAAKGAGTATRRRSGAMASTTRTGRSTTTRQKRVISGRETSSTVPLPPGQGSKPTALIAAIVVVILGMIGVAVFMFGGKPARHPSAPSVPENVPDNDNPTTVQTSPSSEDPAPPVVETQSFEGGEGYTCSGWYRTYGRYDGYYAISCDYAGEIRTKFNTPLGSSDLLVGLACRASRSVRLGVEVTTTKGRGRGEIEIAPGGWKGYCISKTDLKGDMGGTIKEVLITGNAALEDCLMVDALRIGVAQDKAAFAALYREVPETDPRFQGMVTLGSRPPLPGKFYYVNDFNDAAAIECLEECDVSQSGAGDTQAARMKPSPGSPIHEVKCRAKPLLQAAGRDAVWTALIKSPEKGEVVLLVEVYDIRNTEVYWLSKTGCSVDPGWNVMTVPLKDMNVNQMTGFERPPRVPAEIIVHGFHVKWGVDVTGTPPEILVDDVVVAGGIDPQALAAWLKGPVQATATVPKTVDRKPPDVVKGKPQGTVYWVGYEPGESGIGALVDALAPVKDGYPGVAQGLTTSGDQNYRVTLRSAREAWTTDTFLCHPGGDAVVVFAARSKEKTTIWSEVEGNKEKHFVIRYNFPGPLTDDWQIYGFRIKDMRSNTPGVTFPAEGGKISWIDFRSSQGAFEIDSVAVYPDGTVQERTAELKKWIESTLAAGGTDDKGQIVLKLNAEEALPNLDNAQVEVVEGGGPVTPAHAYKAGSRKDGDVEIHEIQFRNRGNNPWFEIGPETVLGLLVKPAVRSSVKVEVEITDGANEIYSAYILQDVNAEWTPMVMRFSGGSAQFAGAMKPAGNAVPSGTKVRGLKFWSQDSRDRFMADEITVANGVTVDRMKDFLAGRTASLVPEKKVEPETAAEATAPPGKLAVGKYTVDGKEIEVVAVDTMKDGGSIFFGGLVKDEETSGVASPNGASMLFVRPSRNVLRYGFSLSWSNDGEELFKAAPDTHLVFNYYMDAFGDIALNVLDSTRRMLQRTQLSDIEKNKWRTAVVPLSSLEPSSGDWSRKIQNEDSMSEVKILAGVRGQGGKFFLHNFMVVNGDKAAVTKFAEGLMTGKSLPGDSGSDAGAAEQTPVKPLGIQLPAAIGTYDFAGEDTGAGVKVRSSKATVGAGQLKGRKGILVDCPGDDASSAGRIEVSLPRPLALSNAGGIGLVISGENAAGNQIMLGAMLNDNPNTVDEITHSDKRPRLVGDAPRLYWAPLQKSLVADKGTVDKIVVYFNTGPNPSSKAFKILIESMAFTPTGLERVLDFEGTGDNFKQIANESVTKLSLDTTEAFNGAGSLSAEAPVDGQEHAFHILFNAPLQTKDVKSIYLAVRLEGEGDAALGFHPSSNGLWDMFMDEGMDHVLLRQQGWHMRHLMPNTKARNDLDTRTPPVKILVVLKGSAGKSVRVWIDDFWVER
ncbi:MAG: hypothetical protein JW909_01295 [Planctomycetes bacterium]|nr:hypothetical protein [Planctomycetota bacterium]